MKGMLLILSMVILRSCWGSPDYHMLLDQQNDISILKTLHGIYKINTLGGKDAALFNLNIHFNNSTKQVSGFSGCNRFLGSYTLKKNALYFNNLKSTKMLCQNEANTIENKLIKIFRKANIILFTTDGFSLYHKKKLLLTAIKEEKQGSVSFEYSSTSRGRYKQIKINSKSISSVYISGGTASKKNIYKKQWDRLRAAVKHMDFESLPKLKAPSKDFLFDGASMARLKINSNGKTYTSPPFDHGNPPEEIAPLVKEILSIIEKIE